MWLELPYRGFTVGVSIFKEMFVFVYLQEGFFPRQFSTPLNSYRQAKLILNSTSAFRNAL
jgi:hypothetical protein